MQTTKKKPSIPLIIIGAVFSAYLGYLVNGAWKQGMEFMQFLESFEQVCSYPLRDYYNDTTPKAIVIALIIFCNGSGDVLHKPEKIYGRGNI